MWQVLQNYFYNESKTQVSCYLQDYQIAEIWKEGPSSFLYSNRCGHKRVHAEGPQNLLWSVPKLANRYVSRLERLHTTWMVQVFDFAFITSGR